MIIINRNLYLFYEHYVWIVRLGKKKSNNNDRNYEHPKLVRDYLTFLPENFTRISHIYQRAKGNEILMIVDDRVYIFEFPSFALSSEWNGVPLTSIGLPTGSTLRTIFRSYSGRTYVFYDSDLFFELDECHQHPRKISNGQVSTEFPGLPTIYIDRAFKYKNGMMYFFNDDDEDDSSYFEYDEVLKQLVRSGPQDLGLFDIHCSDENILQQIHQLLARLEDKFVGRQ